MTKASPPPPPASPSQTTGASSSANAYNTTAEAAAAAANTEPEPPAPSTEALAPPLPSTEDPVDECVICCFPFPLQAGGSIYHECCGESICDGCIVAERRTLIIGTNVKQPITGSREEELEFRMILSNGSVEEENKVIFVCPFCRTRVPRNSSEFLERLWTRIDEYNDPKAMNMMGFCYVKGEHGLSKNPMRAKELFQRSYDLGDPVAAFNLFSLYSNHNMPDQQARRMKYLEEGARRGNTYCNEILGFLAATSGKHEEAKRHLMTAARSGHEEAMKNLMIHYQQVPGSVVSKEDLATTLRAHKAVIDQAKNAPREYAIRFHAFEAKMDSTGQLHWT